MEQKRGAVSVTDIAIYLIVTLFLLPFFIGQYIYQSYFDRSMSLKKIDPADELRTMWWVVGTFGFFVFWMVEGLVRQRIGMENKRDVEKQNLND